MRYQSGCDLSYRIKSETLFIFNVEVAELVRHKDLREMLTIKPDLQRRRYTVPDNKNRYTGVLAPPGDLSLSYSAEVDLQVHRADPATVDEMPLPTLPLDILPFLLWSASTPPSPRPQAAASALPLRSRPTRCRRSWRR